MNLWPKLGFLFEFNGSVNRKAPTYLFRLVFVLGTTWLQLHRSALNTLAVSEWGTVILMKWGVCWPGRKPFKLNDKVFLICYIPRPLSNHIMPAQESNYRTVVRLLAAAFHFSPL